MRITLILLLILYAVKAHSADEVLFIDINNSPQEVKAARESAEKSGRKLVVIPELPPKERKQFMRLKEELNAARAAYMKACAGGTVNKDLCAEKSQKYNEAEQKKTAFAAPFMFTEEKLLAFLKANKDKTFSSLVISGHDGTGSFSGEFGHVSDNSIANALSKYPAMKDSIRSLHLWGCYTTSPGSLLLNWKKHFPNTSLISGYEGRAPLADKPAGWHYLKGVLAKEPELLKAGDSAKLQKLLKKIPGANQVTAAIYACDEYASLKDHYNIGDLQHRCADIKPQIEEKGLEFDCFLKATEEKCTNPPENVGSGPIRQFYELLHKASACGEITSDSIFTKYSRDTAIRLVFNREVQRNFGRIYGKQLAEIDDMLSKMGAPESLRFKDIGSLSRREAIQLADDLLKFLKKFKHDPMQDPAQFKVTGRDGEIASLNTFQQSYTQVLASLNQQCVPFSWTEPDQKEESTCLSREWIGLSGAKKQLEPENRLRSHLLSSMSYDLSDQVEDLQKNYGKDPDPSIQAKIEEYSAQSEKMAYHSRFEGNDIPPDYLKRITEREKYAKVVRELAERGVRAPKSDLSAMRILLEINRPEVEASLASHGNDVKRYEAELKKADLSESDRRYYDSMLNTSQSRMRSEQAVLDATKAIASDAQWDSLAGKADHINRVKDAIGREFRDLEAYEKDSYVKMYDSYLKIGGLNDTDKKIYQDEMNKAAADLLALKNESPANTRLRGHEHLLKLRGKY